MKDRTGRELSTPIQLDKRLLSKQNSPGSMEKMPMKDPMKWLKSGTMAVLG